jgi:hypothetical protein
VVPDARCNLLHNPPTASADAVKKLAKKANQTCLAFGRDLSTTADVPCTNQRYPNKSTILAVAFSALRL